MQEKISTYEQHFKIILLYCHFVSLLKSINLFKKCMCMCNYFLVIFLTWFNISCGQPKHSVCVRERVCILISGMFCVCYACEHITVLSVDISIVLHFWVSVNSVCMLIPSSEYVALYTYESPEPGDLTFTEGDTILVSEREGEWWRGSIGDRSGVFPSNYVKPKETDVILFLYSGLLAFIHVVSCHTTFFFSLDIKSLWKTWNAREETRWVTV